MAIATRTTCTNDMLQADDQEAVIPKCYDTITCNSVSGLPDLSTILTGDVWKVSYFRQSLGSSDDIHNVDHDMSPVHQQYTRIDNLILDIEDPLTSSIDPDTNIATTQGRSLSYSFLRPNVGDVILGTLGDGTTYMFDVTSVEATTFKQNPKYHIDYELVAIADNTNPRYITLLDKTEDTLIFDQNLLASGDPLISPESASDRKDILPSIDSLISTYMDMFIDRDTGYLLQYRDGKGVYDPNVTGFVTCSMYDAGKSFGVNVLPIVKRRGAKHSIYDLLLKRSIGLSRSICQKYCQVPSSDFKGYGDMMSIFSTNLGWVVGENDVSYVESTGSTYWTCPDRIVPTGTDCARLDPLCCGCNDDPMNDKNSDYGRTVNDGTSLIPIIKDPLEDEYYVFSEAFYKEDSDNMSFLEKQVIKYLNNDIIDISDIKVLLEDLPLWCNHALYYYGPILALLARYANAGRPKCS